MNKLLFFLGVRRFTVLIRMDIYKHSCKHGLTMIGTTLYSVHY